MTPLTPLSESAAELEARWLALEPAPRRAGTVALLVLRQGSGVHQTPAEVELSPEGGVHGDRWREKEGRDLDEQVTLMNVRVTRLIAGTERPLHLPGDNVQVDLDLSQEALPAGTRLRLGTALLEVTAAPHLGCDKFAARFGVEALKWVNAKAHRERRLRGVNARVLEGGRVAVGGVVEVVSP